MSRYQCFSLGEKNLCSGLILVGNRAHDVKSNKEITVRKWMTYVKVKPTLTYEEIVFPDNKINGQISKMNIHASYVPFPYFSPVQHLLALALLPPQPKSSHSNPSISCTLQILITMHKSCDISIASC